MFHNRLFLIKRFHVIFQRFYQVDRSRSKFRPGSGLGLAIVKHIAQLHGATVDVEGEVGRGSTFLVRFPTAPFETPVKADVKSA